MDQISHKHKLNITKLSARISNHAYLKTFVTNLSDNKQIVLYAFYQQYIFNYNRWGIFNFTNKEILQKNFKSSIMCFKTTTIKILHWLLNCKTHLQNRLKNIFKYPTYIGSFGVSTIVVSYANLNIFSTKNTNLFSSHLLSPLFPHLILWMHQATYQNFH